MTLITDKGKLVALVDQLFQRRIDTQVELKHVEDTMAAEVFIRPTENLITLAGLVEEHDLALIYDGSRVCVIDAGNRLGEQQVPA